MKLLTHAIYLIIFCLPLYLIRFKIFGIPTTVLEILIYSLFIFWLITRLRITSYGLQIAKLFIPAMLIVTGVTLATIFSSDLRTSAGIWKAWFVDPLLFFIVLISVIKTFEQIKKVFYSLFISGTVVAVISLVYLFQGNLDPMGRLQAFYNSPNYLAMYLAPALVIGFWFVIGGFYSDYSHEDALDAPAWRLTRPRLARLAKRDTVLARLRMVFLASNPRFIFLLPIACLLLAIIFTKSFGAWVGIIGAIGFGLFVYLLKLHKKLAWVILFLTLIVILGLGYFALNYRILSLDARLIIWQKALEIYKANPIIGIGPGTFENYFPPYPEWGVPQPHNIFLAFLLQAGIIGFIGFVWLLGWFFRTGFKSLVTNYGLRITLIMIMVYVLVHGLVDTTYWKNDLSALFWTVIALMTILNSKIKIQNAKC